MRRRMWDLPFDCSATRWRAATEQRDFTGQGSPTGSLRLRAAASRRVRGGGPRPRTRHCRDGCARSGPRHRRSAATRPPRSGLGGKSGALRLRGDDPSQLGADRFIPLAERGLHDPDETARPAQAQHPVQPALATIRRDSARLPRIPIPKLLFRRRRPSDVEVQRRVGKNGSHLARMSHPQRLKTQPLGHQGLGRRPLRMHRPAASHLGGRIVVPVGSGYARLHSRHFA
jgi:hypothetical protein